MTSRGLMIRWMIGTACGLAVVASTPPATADWLVLTDGTSLETRGPWSESGKLVVFTDTDGNLVSLQLADVDLAASHEATADAIAMANQPPPQPEPPQESVFKLTDADVGHIDPEEEESGTEETEGEAGDAGPTAVSVIGWDSDQSDADGVTIRATVENQGEDVALAVSVSVTIYDADGTALATTAAQLESTGLVSGQTTDLVATFPGYFDFTAVTFDVQHRSLATRDSEDVPEAATGEFPIEG